VQPEVAVRGKGVSQGFVTEQATQLVGRHAAYGLPLTFHLPCEGHVAVRHATVQHVHHNGGRATWLTQWWWFRLDVFSVQLRHQFTDSV
jgi:hypothetical protein